MRLVEQWRRVLAGLPPDWGEARLALTVADEAHGDRAASLMGPLTPGRHGNSLRFTVVRRGVGFGPEHLRRLLARLDREGIAATLELVAVEEPPAAEPEERPTLAGAWADALATLPPDWSDLYVELRLRSTDYLERAALLLAPANPARYGGPTGLRFRVARSFGYGASAEMVRRCLERLDESGIRGELEILRALSDTKPVATQGPVWHVGGRTV